MVLRINHARVVSQANSIIENANELSRQINQLTNIEQQIRSAWRGRTCDTFLARLVALRSEMNTTRQQMTNLATTIRNNADRIRREDEDAARRAAALNSGS
jgi:WXG100 family type VII secretion target